MNVKKSRLTASIKEIRGQKTQQQLSMELNMSREGVSKMENGRTKVAPDIAQKLMSINDNPRFALAIRNEYTKTGPIWLDGPNVDLHRSSVKEKTLEELEEVKTQLHEFNFAKPLKNLSPWEVPKLDNLLLEIVELITALETLAVVTCEEANKSYTELWNRHYQTLRLKEYIQ